MLWKQGPLSVRVGGTSKPVPFIHDLPPIREAYKKSRDIAALLGLPYSDRSSTYSSRTAGASFLGSGFTSGSGLMMPSRTSKNFLATWGRSA